MYINDILLGVLGTLFAEMALVFLTAIGYEIYNRRRRNPRRRG